MKRSSLVAIAALSAIGIGFTAAVASVLAQNDDQAQAEARSAPRKPIIATKEQMRNWSPIPKPWQLAGPDPSQVYKVAPIPVGGNVKERTPEQERLFKEAAAILSRLRPIPAERLRFFAWMNAEDSPVVFTGWGGLVGEVTPVPQGWRITFRATPFALLRSGGPALINNIFVEEYLWTNGKLRFLRGFAHPRIGAEPSISQR